MKTESKQVKDICKFVGGSQPPKSEFIHEPKDGYVRLIQIRDRLNDNFITFIPEKSTSKFCEPEDILVGRYGPPIFQIFRGFKGAYNVAIMKAEPQNGVNREFLYYFLIQDAVFRYVDSMSARTAGQTGVELDSLYEYPVRLPDREGQQKIVDVLKSLDNKIENNNKIIVELEKMAKMIYDYYFFQFDFPDENGNPYKASDGEMLWCDELKREIPSKWKAVTFDSILSFLKGKIPAELFEEKTESTYPYLTIDVVNNGKPQYCSKESMYYCNGETIMVMDGAASGDVYVGNNGVLGSTFAMLQSKRSDISDSLIYYMLKAQEPAIKRANTGSTVPHANRRFIEKMYIPICEDMSEFSKKFDSISNKIIHCKAENRELIGIRDFLLPLLMNGQVGFKEE